MVLLGKTVLKRKSIELNKKNMVHKVLFSESQINAIKKLIFENIIEEEKSISRVSFNESQRILLIIRQNMEKEKWLRYYNGLVFLKTGDIKEKVFNKYNLIIKYVYYLFPNQNCYDRFLGIEGETKPIPGGKFGQKIGSKKWGDNLEMVLSFVQIGNKTKPENVTSIIYHEMFHLFQNSKWEHPYEPRKPVYIPAANIADKESESYKANYEGIKWMVAFLIYQSDLGEKYAIMQELYGDITSRKNEINEIAKSKMLLGKSRRDSYKEVVHSLVEKSQSKKRLNSMITCFEKISDNKKIGQQVLDDFYNNKIVGRKRPNDIDYDSFDKTAIIYGEKTNIDWVLKRGKKAIETIKNKINGIEQMLVEEFVSGTVPGNINSDLLNVYIS